MRKLSRRLLLLGVCAFAACDGGDPEPPGDAETDTGTETGDDTTGDPGDPGDPGDDTTGEPEPPDPTPPTPPVVRFIAIGDTGTGKPQQYAVAQAMKKTCDLMGCDFVVMLGDNIYEDGPESVDDQQWQDKFESAYTELDIPFFVALGNHDYGGSFGQGGLGDEFEKGPIEVQYSDVSDKWNMPDTFYTFTWENVGFIMLDTNSLVWDNTDNGDQREWYETALMEVSEAEWVFQAGHHPVRSNGSHGNAGNYEAIEIGGIEIPIPIPTLNGARLAEFFEDYVCGTVDVSLAGHDHNRQWLDDPDGLCGAELIVSGAGAKLKDLDETDRNKAFFQDDSERGFFYFEIQGDRLTGRAIGIDGSIDFERTIRK